MKILAYCCRSFKRTTIRATGVTKPWTCPPLTFDQISPEQLSGWDVWYLDLHGFKDDDEWRGDDGEIALIAGQVREADLAGTVVFALNCWLGNERSPMLRAMLDAGARCVIGGDGPNWSSPQNGPMMYGAALLGRWFLIMLQTMMDDPNRALRISKKLLQASLQATRAAKMVVSGIGEWLPTGYLDKVAGDVVKASEDTMGFRLFTKEDMA